MMDWHQKEQLHSRCVNELDMDGMDRIDIVNVHQEKELWWVFIPMN